MRHILLLSSLLAAAACLSPVTTLSRQRVALQVTNAARITDELRAQLQAQGATLVKPGEHPDLLLRLSDERFERRLLSVLPESGKAAEYELQYSVQLETETGQRSIQVIQDFTYGEEPGLAKRGEEELLREDLLRRAAYLVLLYAAPPDPN